MASWDWKGLTLSIPKILQFFGLEKVNPFHPKNATIFWAGKG
jgi:hypothetical protein